MDPFGYVLGDQFDYKQSIKVSGKSLESLKYTIKELYEISDSESEASPVFSNYPYGQIRRFSANSLSASYDIHPSPSNLTEDEAAQNSYEDVNYDYECDYDYNYNYDKDHDWWSHSDLVGLGITFDNGSLMSITTTANFPFYFDEEFPIVDSCSEIYENDSAETEDYYQMHNGSTTDLNECRSFDETNSNFESKKFLVKLILNDNKGKYMLSKDNGGLRIDTKAAHSDDNEVEDGSDSIPKEEEEEEEEVDDEDNDDDSMDDDPEYRDQNQRKGKISKLPKINIRVKNKRDEYFCNDCGKGFDRKSNRDSHSRVHLTTRPHACSICGRAFVRNSDRKRHEKGHLDICELNCEGSINAGHWGCGESFTCRDALKAHWKTVKGVECLNGYIKLIGVSNFQLKKEWDHFSGLALLQSERKKKTAIKLNRET